MSMNLKQKSVLVIRAGAFALVAIGGLATGLTITTYTLAKANDYVFAGSSETVAPRLDKVICS